MNRVFKVIWNRTKGCYVVVAETAKNMTKRSSLSVVFSKMVGATALAVMSVSYTHLDVYKRQALYWLLVRGL